MGGTIGKNLKKITITFQKKKVNYFFQIFPFGPPYGIFIHPLVPQRKHEKLAKMSLWPKCLWPKCHSGQCVTGQSVTLAKVSLAKVSQAKVTLAKLSLWPKCPWPICHSGQNVILAKVSWPKCLWPKCHSGQNVIQPKIHTKEELKYSCKKALTTYARWCRLMRIESNLSLLPDGWFLVEFIKNY